MTLAESLMLISIPQAVYGLGLVLLFGLRGPSLVAWVLLADFVAVLAIMGAMDFGLLVREPGHDEVTASVMVVWCVTAAILAPRPGLGRVLAMFNAAGVMVMIFGLFWGVQISTTSAIVNAIALIQLAVAGIGSSGADGGGRRISFGEIPVAVSQGRDVMASGGMAKGASVLSQDRRNQ